VIGREELESSGKSTTADLLRSISANTGNGSNETQNSGWSSGAAGIGLRGLSQKNTLVLLNGRRVANYGFPGGGLSDTFVNLNALPMVATQRLEVLKDGASAVYGSDAVAGVTNIITRQNFQGLEFGASYGVAGQGGLETSTAKLVVGHGDLETDGYNILLSLEAYTRNRLDQDQRDLTKSGIYTDLPGGRWNGWSAKGARFLVDGKSVPFLDAQGQCPEGMVLTASAPIDGLAGDTCAINLAPHTTLIPSTDRYQAYLFGTKRLTPQIEAFGEVLYSYVEGASLFGSSPFFTLEGGRFALNAQTGLAEPVSNLLPANNPYNPYGVATPIEYTFFDLGRTLKTNESKSYRALGGVRGRHDRFDWEAAVFASGSDERETVSGGFAHRWNLADALANGTLNLHEPGATPQAVLDGIRLSTLRPAESRLYGADFKISGELFNLPAGQIGYAAGVEFRHESLVSSNPWQIDAGLQIRPAIAAVDGERDVWAAYAEFNIPVLSNLDVQVAARADEYSDFGSAFSPKAGLRWKPLDWLALRASASRGFRAPSLSENSASTMISYGSVIDPLRSRPAQFTPEPDLLHRRQHQSGAGKDPVLQSGRRLRPDARHGAEHRLVSDQARQPDRHGKHHRHRPGQQPRRRHPRPARQAAGRLQPLSQPIGARDLRHRRGLQPALAHRGLGDVHRLQRLYAPAGIQAAERCGRAAAGLRRIEPGRDPAGAQGDDAPSLEPRRLRRQPDLVLHLRL
jgi:iron complex outermembrane receptor protein